MKFGKDFEKHLEETLPEWRDKFLCYKPLKKLLNHHHQQQDINPPNPPNNQDWFVTILNHELQKFNDFYVDKEEDFVIRLQELKERIERVRESKNEPFTCESRSEFSEEEMLEIRKAFVTIHGEMVLLKNYSSLNFAGLVKILKKFDKRTGGLLSLPFTQRALHQPFFTTEPLTGLVRQCEANLELLFPLEEEVIESSGTTPVAAAAATRAQDKYSSVDHNDQKSCNRKTTEEASSAEEEQDTHDDVYRSTLAAMKAIQGLRKASSTYNPLSLARFFHGQDDDDAYGGAVTAENSDSNCPNANQHDKDTDQDSVHLSND